VVITVKILKIGLNQVARQEPMSIKPEEHLSVCRGILGPCMKLLREITMEAIRDIKDTMTSILLLKITAEKIEEMGSKSEENESIYKALEEELKEKWKKIEELIDKVEVNIGDIINRLQNAIKLKNALIDILETYVREIHGDKAVENELNFLRNLGEVEDVKEYMDICSQILDSVCKHDWWNDKVILTLRNIGIIKIDRWEPDPEYGRKAILRCRICGKDFECRHTSEFYDEYRVGRITCKICGTQRIGYRSVEEP